MASTVSRANRISPGRARLPALDAAFVERRIPELERVTGSGRSHRPAAAIVVAHARENSVRRVRERHRLADVLEAACERTEDGGLRTERVKLSEAVRVYTGPQE